MYTRIGAAIVLAVMLGITGYKLYLDGRAAGRAEVQQKWDAAELEHAKRNLRFAEAQTAEVMKARESEKRLRRAADAQRKENANATKRLVAQYERALGELRKRPEARASVGSGGVPDAATPGAGCTGQGLARPDAGFLARYALDASRLKLAYDECRAKYKAAEDVLNPQQK